MESEKRGWKRFIAVVVIQHTASAQGSADYSAGEAFCSAATLTHRAVNHSTISVFSVGNAGTENHPDSSWKSACFFLLDQSQILFVLYLFFFFFLNMISFSFIFFRRIWFKTSLKLHFFMLSLLSFLLLSGEPHCVQVMVCWLVLLTNVASC